MKRGALVPRLDPFGRQLRLVEPGLGLVEVVLGVDPQADALADRLLAGGPQTQALMARPLPPPQVERVLRLVAHHETDGVDVEGAARAEVLHGQHRVARTRDVERRVGVGLRDAHRSPPWRGGAGNCRSAAMDYRAICRSNKASIRSVPSRQPRLTPMAESDNRPPSIVTALPLI